MAQGRAGYWLVIVPLGVLAQGQSREAVMAAIGRRARAEPVDPTICEREPIHIPGSIQPNAVMVAADPRSLAIQAHSANAFDVLVDDGIPLAGRALDGVLPRSFTDLIRACLASHTLDDGRSIRRILRLPGREGLTYYAVTHAHAGRVIVEMELAPEQPEDFGGAS
jgi:light-regulated signal transduction histidine kinase (bacteriophytochrome)